MVEQQKDRFSHAVDEGRQTYQREASASTAGSTYGSTTGPSGTPTGNRGL